MKVVNDLLGYKNFKIVQNDEWFVFSLDSVLLPNFVRLNKSDKAILDIGTGNAPIPLILSTKTLLDLSKLYSIIIGSFNFLSISIFKSTFDCSFDWFKKYSPNPNFNFTSSLWFNTQFSYF